MDLWLPRLCSRSDWTAGALFQTNGLQRDFLCATLEDERRAEKIRGETRIPAGTYEITLRTEGGLHQKYGDRFPDMHEGMLWLRNVPNFEWVYLHVGNTDDDTEGCPLLGESINYVTGFLGSSTSAYRRVYPLIAGAILQNEPTYITIEDIG